MPDRPYLFYELTNSLCHHCLRKVEAKVVIEAWRRHYNQVRPHSSLGYLTPNEFAARQKNAATRQATGQGAAVCGPPRPGPLHHPLRKGHMQEARDAVSS